MSSKVTAPRGTKDVVPAESYKWHYLEGVLRETAGEFGYKEIRFPTFEHTELFLRGVGDTTDVVQKEMYTFEDKGGRSITLRPEGTASVVRSYLENSLAAAGLPVKVYYIAPNFRYEKPQAGRLREHHQFGVEYFGASDATADAEVIALAYTYLKRLGVSGISLEINSIGCPECRPVYHKALKDYFAAYTDKLCETCLGRLEKNPLRILDCKSPVCSAIAAGAPAVTDYLCPECREHFEKLKSCLDALGIEYTVNPHIVRGLDYYTKTVFEFVSDSLGAQSTVCAGGRYDGLVSQLGGQPTPGLGFGSGLERLLLVLEAQGTEIPNTESTDIFVCGMGKEAEIPVLTLVQQLRERGVSAERDALGRSLKAQMKYADKIGSVYAMVIGENELRDGTANLKNMATGDITACKIDAEAIAAAIKG